MKKPEEKISSGGALIYEGAVHRRHAWISVLYALLCTGGVLSLLPFSEMLDVPKAQNLEVRTVAISSLKLAPPEIPEPTPPAPPQEAEAASKQETKPRLDLPRKSKLKKPKLPVSLDLGTLQWAGDFALDFTMAPEGFDFAIQPGEENRIFSLDEVDQPPRPILRNQPVYPYRALRRNQEGFVRIQFTVTRYGHVEDIKVIDSKPGDLFVDAAVKAVGNWRFEPAVKDGKPVAIRTETNLYFQIEG